MGEEAESAEARGAHTHPRPRVAALQPFFDSLLVSCFGTVKIGTSVFELSNSENISCVRFLKPKTAENRNWHCGILLIG